MPERRVVVRAASASYPIHIHTQCRTLIPAMRELVANRPLMVVSDHHVAPLYLEAWRDAFEPARSIQEHTIEPGEQSKDASHYLALQAAMIDAGLGRDSLIIALGGGVVGDLSGFAAATFMRGIDFIQIPTTLLAQVDSSVGGKTGINLPQGKNLVGAFHQPIAVFIDVSSLSTLPDQEYRAGLAETLKYGAIMDAEFFAWMEDRADSLTARDEATLVEAVQRSCRAKAAIVAQDEREAGKRALLNFGHTFGHALEAELGYQDLVHGEAVAVGMLLAAEYSVLRHGLAEADRERLHRLIDRFDLPTRVPSHLDATRLARRMRSDKKNVGGRIRLIVLDALGQAIIDDAGDLALAEDLFARYGARRR